MRTIVFAMLLMTACATAGQSRVKDSAPEKVAAHRAADRSLRLEDEDQRWGTGQAAERKRQQDAARAKKDARIQKTVEIRQGD